MKKVFMIIGLAAAFASQAADYTLDFRAATPVASEAPVLRKAEMPIAVGQIPSVAVGDSLDLQLFDDVAVLVDVADTLPEYLGGKAYSLTLGDGVCGSTLIENAEGLLLELRDIEACRLYSISVRDGRAFIEETDLSLAGRGGCIEVETPELDADGEGSDAASTTKRRLLGAVPGNPFDDNIVAPAPVTVDIMLVFDIGAQTWVEKSTKYSSITNFAIAQVAKMNQVLRNTDLHTNFWYRLVDVMTVDTTYTVVDNQILGIIKNGAESGDGPYGPIKERRAACGADLVSLMIDTGSAYGTTGIGYITHGTTYNTWLGYRAWCYSCCAIRSVDLEYTLSHEVGHNMGLAHSPTLASWTKPGTFDYSNGFNFWGKDDNKPYHTIMAYDQDKNYSGYIEIPYFSSPDYTYQGTVIGTVLSNDCTRALRETCAAFAAWHDTAIPLPSDVTFSPAGSEAYRITLSTLGNYEIRYTTDGSEPTRESTLYTEPLTLKSGSVTIKAVAVVDENTLGAVAKKTYSAAVELSEYIMLEDTTEDWWWGYWRDQGGNYIYPSYWAASADKTAIIDIGGSIAVDGAIDLANLLVGGTTPMEIVTSDKSLHATNLHVIGQATLAGTNYSFDNWKLHDESELVLSPGEGATYSFTKTLTATDSGSTFAVTNGTAEIAGTANTRFGNAGVEVQNGGTLKNMSGGWKLWGTGGAVTIKNGGTLRLDSMEALQRPLVLDGGTVEVNVNAARALEFRDTSSITVTGDSAISDVTSEGNARAYFCRRDIPISVADGCRLDIDISVAAPTDKNFSTGTEGVVKSGGGELAFKREPIHGGATAIKAGALTVDFTSTATNGLGWTVAKGATLRIAAGKSLEVPSLELDEGAILEVSASASAPIAVSNSVALVDVVLKLNGASDLSYGKEYPVMTASGAFTGTKRMDLSDMPSLGDGLAWQMVVDGDTLKARVATTEETASPVPLTSNNDSLVIDVPSDATRITGGGAMINSNPIAIDNVNTKVVAVTIDVEIPEGEQDGEKAICSWNLGGNIARCVRMPSGLLDCYYSDASQTNDRATEDFTLSPGRHLVSVMNYSIKDVPYGGTYIYVDGALAYRSSKLRWADYGISRFTIGATAHATPRYVYDGLNVYGVTVLDLTTNNPLSGMTASGCSPSYGYFNGSYPTVFGLPPSGGFMMNATNLVATLDKSADSISVSVIASFSSSAKGTIFAIWTRPAEQNAYSTAQAEYSGDGTFFLRYNGNTYTNPFTRVNDGDDSVDEPHLYTLTYSSENGVCFYQDGIEILHQDEVFKDSGNLALYRVNFGCGAWSTDNPNPMPDFKVYASHIALGTDDRTVSENAVNESYSASNQEESEDPALPATPATVDILVAYDNGAQTYVSNKGVTLAEFAQTQIGKMNDVLVTNKLDRFYSYRLAGVCKVDGTYTNIDTAPGLIAAGEGPAVSLRAAREIYGADTVTLLVDTTSNTIGNSSPLNSPDNVASQHECAFSVCSIRAVDTGKQHTMIHENAHNMGCGHARAQGIINSPFEYGRGFYFKDGNVTRHTIMAYGGDNDASWYFSTTSKEFGFVLGDATNDNARVLKETCGEVAKWREGAAIDLDGSFATGDAVWQTGRKYPWSVEGNVIRSFNQTDYTYQCTTPLKATVVGPKRLSFSHKSYFGGATLGGANYSHFDVLLDDSPVLTQTECTNSWTDAFVVIPDGTHEVTFVFSQRFAMNNSDDYKDETPEADDAVWLKDIALSEIPMCRHTSTSDNVTWTFPSDAVATSDCLGGIILADNGIKEALNFGSTNAVILSVLAELPDNGEGALLGLVDVKGSSKCPIYAYANGDGTISIYYDDSNGSKKNTLPSAKSSELDVAGLHVWTLAYAYDGGGYLYCDGKLVASDAGIKWTGSNSNLHKPAECLMFGSAYTNAYPLSGTKIYAVHSDFGDSNDVFNKVSSSVDKVLSSFDCLLGYADESQATKLALLRIYKDTGSVIGEAASECVLRISEIMPKPTDDRTLNGREGMDVNGLESGWVEVENTSDQWADLNDYRFIRVNRGKKTDPAGVGNFPSRLVPPHGRAIFYTSERYSNSKDQAVSAFAEGTFDGKPMIFEDYGNILVWGDKVNPKKSPYVRLYYAPGGDSDKGTVVDTVVVPSDLPEGWSIIVGDAEEGEGTRRWMCPTPTRGTANTKTDGLTRIGPNVGPLYENKTVDKKGKEVVGAKHDSANEFARVAPPAKSGEAYEITFSFNPVMSPTEAAGFRDEDKISSITLVYRAGLTGAENEVAVDMDTDNFDPVDWGHTYKAEIPADKLPGAGQLVQWKFRATDASGNEWTSPSFNNPDDGYEWYGTIVEAPGLESATLPTWHMFADSESLEQMDVDASDQTLANNARIAIYDSSTSNYYDYVRIDLRGNTSAKFTKKSHGLRFAKAHPLTMTDVVTGETIKEIRKTSLISEFADPSYMRQMIAFWLWRKMGNLVPFDFPIRCNLNGAFYQLAFNSERFTDELIEDVYELDKYGYSYKNVGWLESDASTTAGGIEKKTPDDEKEDDLSVLTSELTSNLISLNGDKLTEFVVEKFDLPAWINYLASARITQEMDDVWANLCIYYDNAQMHAAGGVRGTDTWKPLGYDFNLSLGQWYYNDSKNQLDRFGLMSNQDWYKSHPLYGGRTIRAYRCEAYYNNNYDKMNGNYGYEAVLQSPKFRRLFLRRLRTLMDQELKAPGTLEGATPFMFEMRKLANLMRDDARLDVVWRQNDTKYTDSAIDVWGDNRPEDMDAGIDDIWENYVVPRRQHLYVTHSITNTSWAVGYASDKNAGIPEAQSPFEALAVNITVDYSNLDHGVIVISNGNDEVVDMSGWTLKTGTEKKEAWTLPAGTVCDSNDCIYVVADRRKYISDHADELTDQVIVGNATFGTSIPEEPLTYPETETSSGTVSISEEPVVFSAANDDEAAAWVESLTPQLTEEQIADKLTADKFTVVAKEVPGEPGKYQAVVDLNPVTVEKPEVDTSLEEPVEIEEDTEDPDKKKVSVSISNAIKGLWYGYEVSDELGESAAFTNDVDSFERATGSAHKVRGSPRDKSKTSGFFRLKVLPAKPSKTSE